MIIKIPYGKEKITLDILDKNIQDIISEKENNFFMNEKNIIDKALKNPVGSVKLSELSKGSKNACIIVSDITRPCPSYKFLPSILQELISGGVDYKDIKIILALGIHRKHNEIEKKQLVGDFCYEKVKIMDSNPLLTRKIGTTSFGTPVEVFKEVLNNNLLIATGNIEYHYFAGYSGGAKAVMPGICSRNSIQANHKMMLDEKSVAGNYLDNPIRRDIEEAGKLVGIDFIFNVILDEHKKIIDAIAGSNNEAWIEGVKRYNSLYNIEVASRADIVIVSPGGFPKDINLYQAQKALDNVKDLAEEGGTIILIALCNERFGEDVFENWMEDARDYELICRRLKENFELGGHKAVAISKVTSSKNVFLYSDFDKKTTQKMGFAKITDIQLYLNERIKRDNKLKITIVPNGRFVKVSH